MSADTADNLNFMLARKTEELKTMPTVFLDIPRVTESTSSAEYFAVCEKLKDGRMKSTRERQSLKVVLVGDAELQRLFTSVEHSCFEGNGCQLIH